MPCVFCCSFPSPLRSPSPLGDSVVLVLVDLMGGSISLFLKMLPPIFFFLFFFLLLFFPSPLFQDRADETRRQAGKRSYSSPTAHQQALPSLSPLAFSLPRALSSRRPRSNNNGNGKFGCFFFSFPHTNTDTQPWPKLKQQQHPRHAPTHSAPSPLKKKKYAKGRSKTQPPYPHPTFYPFL